MGAFFFRWKKSTALGLLLLIWFYFSLPRALFLESYSPVLLDDSGQVLDARVAQDQQWRFPPDRSGLPRKYLVSLLLFEDQRFYQHPGIDPLAVLRAIWQNIQGAGRVSGASTITMQVIRLWRKKPRTWWHKIHEAILALRLELGYSKPEILALYAAHTPMGGNVVGAWAASWLYFGRPLRELSWAESALLAVLPNAPSALNPGKGREELLKKRNRLLNRLCEKQLIDEMTRDLACQEPLPGAQANLPERLASHLLDSLHSGALKKDLPLPLYQSTINQDLQARAEQVMRRHQALLAKSRINDLCALIIDHQSGLVKAYIGNAAFLNGSRDQSAWLDLIHCPRSTGSILKPFLYASMLQEGEITPLKMIEDIPTFIWGFTPQNFGRNYLGAVACKDALAFSLNVPAVRMLKSHGLQRFYDRLQDLGMTSLVRPAEQYGLTLILGGAEGTLWNMAELYSKLAQRAMGDETPAGFRPLAEKPLKTASQPWPIGAGASYQTLEALTEVARPGLEGFWRSFVSSRRLSWKTGTSHGFRDAWALGVTPQYTIAVWIGNADGEGRPEISGLTVAAPVLFNLYQLVSAGGEFPPPWGDLKKITVCQETGYLPGPYCHDTLEVLMPKQADFLQTCPFHQRIFLDKSGKFRVDGKCEQVSTMQAQDRLMLPPLMAYYYERWQPAYKQLPPWRYDCFDSTGKGEVMNLVYPPKDGLIYIPTQLDGQQGAVVFRVVHRQPERRIYWHIDDEFIGETRHFHELSLAPLPGVHRLTLVDEDGNRLQRRFTMIDKQTDRAALRSK